MLNLNTMRTTSALSLRCTRNLQLITLVLLVSTYPLVARAAWSPSIDFSGFGTLGYATIDNDTARYRVGLGEDGTTSSGSFLLDSRLALQADADIARFLTGTLQVLAREDQQGDFAPRVEWAFLKYRLSQVYTVRGGLLSLPLFRLSDSREVGYATPYLRPPEDLYGQIPIRNFEGVDILADLSLGDLYINAQGYAGVSEDQLGGGVKTRSSGAGFNVSAEYGSSRFRVNYMYADASAESASLDQVRAGLAQAALLVPGAAGLYRDFERGTRQKTSKTEWFALGLAFDFDRFFVDTEYAFLSFDNWLADTSSWYIAGGYRAGNFTPYALLSSTRQVGRPDAVIFPDTPEFNALAGGIATLTTDPSQESVALGLRWDFASKLALKFQIDRIHREDKGLSFRNLTTESSGDDGKDVTLYSMTLDFVF